MAAVAVVVDGVPSGHGSNPSGYTSGSIPSGYTRDLIDYSSMISNPSEEDSATIYQAHDACPASSSTATSTRGILRRGPRRGPGKKVSFTRSEPEYW